MNSSIPDVERKPTRFRLLGLIVCLLLAIGFRLVVIRHESHQLTIDRDAYLGIAKAIAEGHGYCNLGGHVPTAFRPPLYPMILGISSRIAPVAVAVATINLVCGLVTVLLTADLSRRLRVGSVGWLAVLVVAIDPLLLQYAARPMTESLCALLSAFWIWSVIVFWPERTDVRTARSIICGVTFGLLVLSRPTFWPIAGFCILIWTIELRKNRAVGESFKRSIMSGFWAACGTAIVVAPWLIRNWIVFGVPILTTTHGGYTLLLGNNPVFYDQVVNQPWGTMWPDSSQHEWEENLNQEMNDKLGPNASEVERDAWQADRAKSYIRSQPGHFAKAAVHRVRSLWNTVPLGDAARNVNQRLIAAVGWYYCAVLILGMIGVFRVLRNRDRGIWLPLLILIASVQIVHLFYWTNTRMRAPLTPAIALLAAAAIAPKRAI